MFDKHNAAEYLKLAHLYKPLSDNDLKEIAHQASNQKVRGFVKRSMDEDIHFASIVAACSLMSIASLMAWLGCFL